MRSTLPSGWLTIQLRGHVPDLEPLSKVERLELDIDGRLHEMRQEMYKFHSELDPEEGWKISVIVAFVRAAYDKGYCDALRDDAQGERGKLYIDNGYAVPDA